jgi:hypothetical protein
MGVAGTFEVDFQLNDGGGTTNNTATINNFAFGGGNPVGSPTILMGGANGDLSGTVTLTDDPLLGGGFINEFAQQFNLGSALSFDVQLTTNVDSPAPDQFSFAILHNGVEIPTTGTGDAFLIVDLDSINPSVQTFRSDLNRTNINIAAPTATSPTTAVPEPSSIVLIGAGLLVMLPFLFRKRCSLKSRGVK